MRRIVTGVDAEGRSCVVEDGEVGAMPIEGLVGLRSGTLWATESSPPAAPPPQEGHYGNVNLPPGRLRWFLVDNDPPEGGVRPEIATRMHHQDALELVFVLSGSTRLVLDADERQVNAGDCVVLPGIDHAFETGPEGCQMMAVALGMSPSA